VSAGTRSRVGGSPSWTPGRRRTRGATSVSPSTSSAPSHQTPQNYSLDVSMCRYIYWFCNWNTSANFGKNPKARKLPSCYDRWFCCVGSLTSVSPTSSAPLHQTQTNYNLDVIMCPGFANASCIFGGHPKARKWPSCYDCWFCFVGLPGILIKLLSLVFKSFIFLHK